jgi:Mn2+/Fe2+ NRAMP family transporter
MFSMALTVLALPLLVGPLIVIMNDKQWLKQYTNGVVTNTAVIIVILIAFVLAALAVPVQLTGS